ncbi:Lipid A biosynthesis lauroyltransferase [Campylobacter majalis]|uniref:Lipid A biosynthesis lauroyltransferase n=1 Tax=Campylobacter majalis TaxID=2790656 RepID=A0ABM8Q4F8_9BACT|nr:lysophospholipid acyltransferase family protein [Campylobacter majalis]CAD7287684.1 Lipid A biosynthesis lauroyltransferase [Campylobacter majalis]
MKEKIEYILVNFFIFLHRILPSRFMQWLLKCISDLLFFTLKSRRELTIDNIIKAYGKSLDEASILARANFNSLAKTIMEILDIYNDKRTLDSYIINAEEAKAKLKEISAGRQILFTTAHFGNWEILAHYFGAAGFEMVVIGREGNNRLIDTNITVPFRKRFGNELANKDNAMSKMVKFLKNGKNVGVMIDQKAGSINSIKTTFFGRECMTTKTIGSLKLKFNPVIVPIFAIRQDDGRFKIIIREFDESVIKGDKDADILAITQQINDIFEDVVRMAPQQWFWMHNRWKMD